LICPEGVVKDRRRDQPGAGSIPSCFGVDILRASFSHSLGEALDHLCGDLKGPQHKFLAEDATIELDHGSALLCALGLDTGLFEGDGAVVAGI
jgi:hypothetical protein